MSKKKLVFRVGAGLAATGLAFTLAGCPDDKAPERPPVNPAPPKEKPNVNPAPPPEEPAENPATNGDGAGDPQPEEAESGE